MKIGHWIMTAWTILPDITGRSMLFADANHGVIVARYTAPVGVFRTADGGGTWEFVALPKSDDGNGVVSAQNFARIDATHWIACGAENTGTYYGIGTPFRFTVWETADAGATWAIKRSWLEDYASCTAVDADKSGHALLFATPFLSAAGCIVNCAARGVPGAASPATTSSPTPGTARPMSPWWDPRSGFVRLSKVRPALGLFKSSDYGATFTKISDVLPQYMDFASSYKGFAPAGGPMYATYDGGLTWLKQSNGGGICCHGNYIWAFDTMNAIWKDGGVGDPNGFADVLRLYEPRSANFEILPGSAVRPGSLNPGAANVPIIGLKFVNNGPMPLKVTSLGLQASGTGKDHLDVAAVKAWWDHDGDGVVNVGDVMLVAGAYSADNGLLTLNLGTKQLMQPRVPFNVLVTYDFGGYITTAGTFWVTVTPSDVVAQSADVGTALIVSATAPAGTVLESEATQVSPSTVALSALTLKKSIIAGCLSVSGSITLSEPAPASGIVVQLSDTITAANTPVSVTVPAGLVTKSFTVKTVPVAASESGSVRATLGTVVRSQPLTVRPMGMLSVALTPNPILGGNTTAGTAKLECKAGPGPIAIDLASTNATIASPTTSRITVAAGMQSGAFLVTTSPVAASTRATISATTNGTTKQKVLTVLPP